MPTLSPVRAGSAGGRADYDMTGMVGLATRAHAAGQRPACLSRRLSCASARNAYVILRAEPDGTNGPFDRACGPSPEVTGW